MRRRALLSSERAWTNLVPRIGVTRAGDTATRFNSAGQLVVVPANTARIDYDPSTLVRRGLLVEALATNLALRANEFSNAAWVKSNATVAANIDDGEGGTSAYSITSTAISGSIQQAPTVTSGVAYTSSFWIKRLTGSGTVSLRCGDTTLIPVTVTSSWTRVQASAVPSTTTGRIAVVFGASGDAVAVKYSQLELGPVATSYIPTVGSVVTRAADQCLIDGTDFSSFWNQDEGTVYTEFEMIPDGSPPAARVLFCASDGTVNNRIYAFVNVDNKIVYGTVVGGGAAVLQTSADAILSGVNKAAFTYKSGVFRFALNGAISANDNVPVMPILSEMHVGAGVTWGATTFLNGWIPELSYSKRLGNEYDLLKITA